MASEATNKTPNKEDLNENGDMTMNINCDNITMCCTNTQKRPSTGNEACGFERSNSQYRDQELDIEGLEYMKTKWKENYSKLKNKPIHERDLLAKVDRNFPERDLMAVNKLLTEIFGRETIER